MRTSSLFPRATRRTAESLLMRTFGGLILIGTLLLWSPFSHRGHVGFVDALFTATSAVCVTGLVVVDTGTDFTLLGQLIILLLIQIGGIGILLFAWVVFDVMGRKLSMTAHDAVHSSILKERRPLELKTALPRILRYVLVVEGVGAALLFAGLLFEPMSVGEAFYSAVFHSISAFCNAGFSIYSDSLVGLRDNALVYPAICALILFGSLGHPIVVEAVRGLWRRRRFGDWSISTRTALVSNAVLLPVGAVSMLFLGLGASELSGVGQGLQAFFQSVTARTAGFNTVDIGAMPTASLCVLVVLMFIGGSPGSCAGGVKTTTWALWCARLVAVLRGDGRRVRIFDRHIAGELAERASLIIALAVLWNAVGVIVLSASEDASLSAILFEQVSAFGTVGLSTGLTPELSLVGRLWIIATMFIGKLGPLTVALGAVHGPSPSPVTYPEERMMIG